MTNRTLVIIDGNSLINRAYYAMQRPMITKAGLYTHGVYGFINMLSKIEKDYNPAYMTVTFDLKAPTFRHLEYEGYKANRKGMPVELAMQMPLLKEVLDAMNIHRMELEGFEGDDLIGTVARRGEEAGLEPLIITGDKDALQLATDITKVLITKKGISEFELFDAEHMMEVYGLTPLQFIDYKGLRGDTSDNIPGIPGVGEKTALKLLKEYKSVENLIQHADDISQAKLREKVKENANLAILSKKLATINTNAPIEFTFEELQCKKLDFNRLVDCYVKLEFNSFLKRLKVGGNVGANAMNGEAGAVSGEMSTAGSGNEDGNNEEETVKYNFDYEICDRDKAIEMIDAQIASGEPVCLTTFSDGNHKDKPEILGFAFLSGNKVCFIREEDKDITAAVVLRLSESGTKLIGHNLKEDYYAFMANFSFRKEGMVFNTAFDTDIAEYILNPTGKDYSLKKLSLEYLHEDLESFEEFDEAVAQLDMFTDSGKTYAEFAAKYITRIMNVYQIQKRELRKNQLENIAQDIEFPLVEVMASMEKEGFRIDEDTLKNIGNGLKEKIDELTKEIYSLAGEEFNINSPKQLGTILFEKMQLPHGKKTKSGYSTSADILEKLKEDYPVVAKILEYRMYAKLNSTYIEGLLPLKAVDGKIHAHFQQTVTATGRISCTEPNLQNIPVRNENGKAIRKAFIPLDEDHILVGADYSQIELRILAHLSEEEQLIEAFNQGMDIHRLTASRVFNTPFEDVTSLQRSNAKAVNFGVIYGMSGFGLSEELGISRKSAEKYIKDYFEKYTAVKEYMDNQVKFCRENGYSVTMLGRKRVIPEIGASNFMVRQLGERLAMNTPIQGTAADIIKLAMIKTYEALRKGGFKSKLILQVHDELIIDTLKSEEEAVKKLLVDSMENVAKLKVKLIAEPESALDWYSLK